MLHPSVDAGDGDRDGLIQARLRIPCVGLAMGCGASGKESTFCVEELAVKPRMTRLASRTRALMKKNRHTRVFPQ
jgi:hypothetical protein